MKPVKHEALFQRLALIEAEPNDHGRRQFFRDQSFGEKPANPDPYYVSLTNGHWQLKCLVEQYRESYGTANWPGWFQLERDFLQDAELFNLIFRSFRPCKVRMNPGAESIFPEERSRPDAAPPSASDARPGTA